MAQAFSHLQNIAAGIWLVTAQMAPYLLFGFLVAGVLHVLVSAAWVERHLGGRGFGPIVKAVLFGVPLPLCSCGVIAVAASIRRHGASRGATAGFLLATPQTGVDSIFATWGLLGPVFGVFRPLVALLTGMLGGAIVSLTEPKAEAPADMGEAPPAEVEVMDGATAGQRVARALRYGLVTLPRDIARPLVLGIVVAALVGALLPEKALAPYIGGGILAMVVMVSVGIPIYVCSTASIPIAVGFMHLGASPGAALAFLIAGPATNAATFTTVWTILGRRTAMVYLGTVFFGAIISGLLLDGFFSALDRSAFAALSHDHEMMNGWFFQVSGAVLALVVAGALMPMAWLRRIGMAGRKTEDFTVADRVTLEVKGMTCSHCSGAVERGLRGAPGVTSADVDLESGRAVVRGNALDHDALVRVVRELGYEAGPAVEGV